MPACTPVRLALALLLLLSAPAPGARMVPGSDLHPQLPELEIDMATATSGLSTRSGEIGLRPVEELEAPPEAMRSPDQASLPGEKDRSSAIRERAVRLMQRLEAEVAWRFGRVAAR